MEKFLLDINFKAPYYKVGSMGQRTKTIWVIYHGYGQLAEEFAESFSSIDPEKNVLIFPQGLSKFYLKGVDKQIGSNWMTAHDRELDISNYLGYLDQLYTHEIKPYIKDAKLYVLGFSQGGHTASRWIQHAKVRYHKLILWGSSLVHEINTTHVKESFSSGENITIVGDQDRFVSQERLAKLENRYAKIGFKHKLIEYQGGHDIYPEILKKIF